MGRRFWHTCPNSCCNGKLEAIDSHTCRTVTRICAPIFSHRSRIVPVMSVRLGTGEVCVVGEPGDRMDLGLGDDPGRMSSATGSVDWTRGLQAFFRTPSGTEAIASGGLTVEGRIGDLNITTRLDDMVIESVGLEPSSPRLNLGVTALGPVGREGFGRLRLTDDCAADAFSGVLPAWVRVGEGTPRLGRAYGSFDVSSEGRLREADLWRNGIELAFETSDGHRQYIVAYPFAPLGRHVDTDRDREGRLTIRVAGILAPNRHGHILRGGRRVAPVPTHERSRTARNLAGSQVPVGVGRRNRQANLRRRALEDRRVVRHAANRRRVQRHVDHRRVIVRQAAGIGGLQNELEAAG